MALVEALQEARVEVVPDRVQPLELVFRRAAGLGDVLLHPPRERIALFLQRVEQLRHARGLFAQLRRRELSGRAVREDQLELGQLRGDLRALDDARDAGILPSLLAAVDQQLDGGAPTVAADDDVGVAVLPDADRVHQADGRDAVGQLLQALQRIEIALVRDEPVPRDRHDLLRAAVEIGHAAEQRRQIEAPLLAHALASSLLSPSRRSSRFASVR